MRPEILIVDDEPDVRSTFLLIFRRRGWMCYEAATAKQAQAVIRDHPGIGIVFTDVQMSGQPGLGIIRRMRSENPKRNIEFVIVSRNAGVEDVISALRLGATDFLVKPARIREVWRALEKCHQRFKEREEQQALAKRVLAEVATKNSRIRDLVQDVAATHITSMETLAIAAEHRDNDTGEHIRRIGAFARVLAEGLGWPSVLVERIERAAHLHDIGKIGVPDRVLLKSGRLTQGEWTIMKRHAEVGGRILGISESDETQCAAQIALLHHERWDGSGYPHGLSGTVIPIDARIVAVCDVYDALRSQRPYKAAFDHATAVRIIREGDERTRPEHFDPEILDLFARKQQEFAEVFDGQSPS